MEFFAGSGAEYAMRSSRDGDMGGEVLRGNAKEIWGSAKGVNAGGGEGRIPISSVASCRSVSLKVPSPPSPTRVGLGWAFTGSGGAASASAAAQLCTLRSRSRFLSVGSAGEAARSTGREAAMAMFFFFFGACGTGDENACVYANLSTESVTETRG